MPDLIRPDASFTPRELFARMQGAWFEPRIGIMWQDNNGVTATTSGGQTMGLLLGLDQQLQSGPKLNTGTFTNSGSFPYSTFTASGGDGFVGTTVGAITARAYVGVVSAYIGRYVEISGTILSSGVSACTLNFSSVASPNSGLTSGVIASANGSFLFRLLVPAAAVNILFISVATGASTTTLTNFSVREISGNHAYQATFANRPTLQYNGNLPLIRFDSNDVLTASLPNLGSGVFSSAGSVYFATPQGMSCLHNQSIGTTYNLPALQTDIYGTVITPARLAPPLEQRLALYMHRLAGLSDADFFWQEQATDGMTGQLLADDNDTILLRA